MRRLALLVLLFPLSCSAPAPASPPEKPPAPAPRPVQADPVPALVEQLRDDRIVEREAAGPRLKEIGNASIPALERAAQDPDVEFSSRAKALLKALTGPPKIHIPDPDDPVMSSKAPDSFKVRFDTNQGSFTVKLVRDWAPLGAERFFNLVRHRYYDECRFFRVIKDFMAQFGIHGHPETSTKWKNAVIEGDPVKESNTPGRITFATTRGKGTRTTQLFINFKNHSRLDASGFSPFGEVVEGMDIASRLYSGYGEGGPGGSGPLQNRIQAEGNAYLAEFEKLGYIKKAEIIN